MSSKRDKRAKRENRPPDAPRKASAETAPEPVPQPPPAAPARAAVGAGSASAAWRFSPLALALAALVAYSNSFSAPFVFDDEFSIVENPHIRSLSLDAFRAPDQSSVAGRPIASFTLAIDHAIGGLDPASYHRTNLAIHILAGLALFGFLRATFAGDRLRDRYGNRATPLAFAIALVWLVHPLQTESVTYVVQRVESLMGLFFLATFFCFARAAASPRPAPWRIATVACALLGMASKEVMVAAPPLLLIYDRLFLSSSWRETFARRGKLHAAVWATLALLVALVAGGPRADSAGFGMSGREKVTALEYARSQFGVILHYLRLCFWPHPLVLDYSWPVANRAREIVPQAIVVLGLVVATLAAIPRRPDLAFAGLWFFFALGPTSSFMPIVDLAFEHRMYVPLAGVVAVVVVAADGAIARFAAADRATATRAAALALVAAALVATTIRRNEDYRTGLDLYTDVVDKNPDNPRGRNNRGTQLYREERFAEAEAEFRAAVALDPDYVDALYNLGNAVVAQGRFDEAIAAYESALAVAPAHVDSLVNLSTALLAAERRDEAEPRMRAALNVPPERAEQYRRLAENFARLGKLEDARRTYLRAIQVDPKDAPSHLALGNMYFDDGNGSEALRHLTAAIAIAPNDAAIVGSYAVLTAHAGRADEALGLFRRAHSLAPDSMDANLNLASALAARGAFGEALPYAERAVAAEPDLPVVLNKCGTILAALKRYDEAIARFSRALELAPDNEEARRNLETARRLRDGG